jgi:hypothetical protein
MADVRISLKSFIAMARQPIRLRPRCQDIAPASHGQDKQDLSS